MVEMTRSGLEVWRDECGTKVLLPPQDDEDFVRDAVNDPSDSWYGGRQVSDEEFQANADNVAAEKRWAAQMVRGESSGLIGAERAVLAVYLNVPNLVHGGEYNAEVCNEFFQTPESRAVLVAMMRCDRLTTQSLVDELEMDPAVADPVTLVEEIRTFKDYDREMPKVLAEHLQWDFLDLRKEVAVFSSCSDGERFLLGYHFPRERK